MHNDADEFSSAVLVAIDDKEDISSNAAAVQLRIVQPEHGGGSCNCWRMNEISINEHNITLDRYRIYPIQLN